MDWQGLTWGQFARRATPATLGALAMLGALAFATHLGAENGSAVGVYLALIAALTVPHAATVTLLDSREGLWQPD